MAGVLAIVAGLTYGAGDFLGGIATKRIGESLGVVAVSSAVGVALLVVLLPATGGDPTEEPAMWLVLEPSGDVRQFGAGPVDLDTAPPPASATACVAGR